MPVGFLIFRQTDLHKPLPERPVFRIALFQFVKLGAGLVVERRIFLGLLMETDIEFHQFIHAAFFNHFTVAPTAIGHNQFAELCPPVPQIVDANAVITRKFMQFFERMSNDRCAQMTDMKGFGHIGRGIVKHHGLPLPEIGGTITLPGGKNIGKHRSGQIFRRDPDVKIAGKNRNFRNAVKACQRTGKRLGNLNGRAAQRAAQFKTRKRQIAHLLIGRIFQHGRNLRRTRRIGHTQRRNAVRKFFGNLLFDGQHKKNPL